MRSLIKIKLNLRLLFLSCIAQQYVVMFPWKPEFTEDDTARKIEYPRTMRTITLLPLGASFILRCRR